MSENRSSSSGSRGKGKTSWIYTLPGKIVVGAVAAILILALTYGSFMMSGDADTDTADSEIAEIQEDSEGED